MLNKYPKEQITFEFTKPSKRKLLSVTSSTSFLQEAASRGVGLLMIRSNDGPLPLECVSHEHRFNKVSPGQ